MPLAIPPPVTFFFFVKVLMTFVIWGGFKSQLTSMAIEGVDKDVHQGRVKALL